MQAQIITVYRLDQDWKEDIDFQPCIGIFGSRGPHFRELLARGHRRFRDRTRVHSATVPVDWSDQMVAKGNKERSFEASSDPVTCGMSAI